MCEVPGESTILSLLHEWQSIKPEQPLAPHYSNNHQADEAEFSFEWVSHHWKRSYFNKRSSSWEHGQHPASWSGAKVKFFNWQLWDGRKDFGKAAWNRHLIPPGWKAAVTTFTSDNFMTSGSKRLRPWWIRTSGSNSSCSSFCINYFGCRLGCDIWYESIKTDLIKISIS